MNSFLRQWVDERICDLDKYGFDYDNHVDQFVGQREWGNIYSDCIDLLIEATDYIIEKKITNVVVFLNIALIQRNICFIDYDFDLTGDIQNFIFDSGNTPPSLYVYRPKHQEFKDGNCEYYVRPLEVDSRLKKYDCTKVYRCERDVQDISADYPFYRDIQIKCYL
jgi:hypothetical protein